MAASKEDRMAQGTKTRRQTSPTWLCLPLAVSDPWDWHCLEQLPTCGVSSSASFWPGKPRWFGHCSSKLLLLRRERKPTHWAPKPIALAPTAPSRCCGYVLWNSLWNSFGPKKWQFLGDTCQATSLASQQERGLCAPVPCLLKGSLGLLPHQNLPLQGGTRRVYSWPSGLKGTLTQTAWIDVEEKWNTIHIFWVAQDSWKKENALNTLEHTQTKLYPKWIVPVKQIVRSTQGLLKMGRALAYIQS